MKKKCAIIFYFLVQGSGMNALFAQDLSATDIVRKADENFNGEKSSYSVMSMKVIRPEWQRTIEFKNWTLGREYGRTCML